MRHCKPISAGLILLLLGAAVPAFARQERHERQGKLDKEERRGKPQKQERQGKPEVRQREARPGHEEKLQRELRPQPPKGPPPQREQPQQRREPRNLPPPQRSQPQHRQEPKSPPQQQAHQRQPDRPMPRAQERRKALHQRVWQKHRASDWKGQHRGWNERGGYHGYRIPETRYRTYFGPEHAFRIFSHPLRMVGGLPRFQFGGFWFGVIDPWPEYWSDDWFDNDDVYIDYSGDGYYLYNRRHLEDRIAITVHLN